MRPVIGQALHESLVASWAAGAESAIERLPAPPGIAEPPKLPPPPPTTLLPDPEDWGPEPLLRLDASDAALANLHARRILTPAEYYRLDARARSEAFTVSGLIVDDSITKLHDALTEVVDAGGGWRNYRAAVLERFDSLPLAPHKLEQVFRNNTAEAYSQGVEAVLDHPLVGDAFPYRLYAATHDARARHTHLALEHYGLDATAVYHKSDPTWQRFRPPWEWGCRCDWVAIDVATAARMGVTEAQQWQRTGVEPVHSHVQPPPFQPPASWDRLELA